MEAPKNLERLYIDPARKGGRPRSRRYLKWVLWGGLLVALVAGYRAMPYLIPVEAETTSLTRVDPETTTNTVVLNVTGYVAPHRRLELAPKVIARVIAVYADKGDRVTSGQIIVRLEEREYQANLDRANAAVERAQARLDELRNGSRKEEVEEARSNTQLAELQRDDARRTVGRLRPLVTARVENQQALDTAITLEGVAEARLAATRRRLDLLVAGPRPESIRAAEADLAEAQALEESARIQVEDCVIRAPISGTVLERIAEVGELVTNQNFGGRGARGALLSMADLNDMQVEVDLNQVDLSRVKLGQVCRINLEAYPEDNYDGRVVQVAPEANRQKATVQVKVQVNEPDEKMRPEMNARVSFLEPVSAREGVKAAARVFAPVSAIVERNGSPTVVVVKDGRAQLVAVKRGLETPNGVEITQGLTGEETIILKPGDGIRDGIAVRAKGIAK
ncbi:hypothetical protein CVU37_13285 [candidate division BRC1 bacterium HGW-BRC1-1]|jgi:HlyD family secretion protein|nr:MAG: hypothetical protein CVU37_13285 [candidate division BRC1 bacterium HGW-BRC1-1]